MTDLDVLTKLMQSCQCGNISPIKKRNPRHKDAWIWRVSGDDAAMVMNSILPHMGARRSEKIKSLLSD